MDTDKPSNPEESRHRQLMDFMLEFKSSVTDQIKTTNEKLDHKLDIIEKDMKNMKDTIDENDVKHDEVQKRMDQRLLKLEEQMKKSTLLRQNREQLINKDRVSSGLEDLTKQPHRRKSFERRSINQDELVNENSAFKSMWAKEMESQLAAAAGVLNDNSDRTTQSNEMEGSAGIARQDTSAQKEAEQDYSEIIPWRNTLENGRTKVPKIRKPPPPITSWFGDLQSDVSDDSSSSGLESGNDKWQEVERKKKVLLKKKLQKAKKKEKMEEVATKLQHMVGVGPICVKSEYYYRSKNLSAQAARIAAIKEYLEYNLDYNTEELAELNIMDTKRSGKEDVIYFALDDVNQVKEVHYRRAAAANDDLIVRDYIAPQYYERYMALGRRAAQLRAEDKTLKTQLRWGSRDIEIFTKTKGAEDMLKKVDIKTFMGDKSLPDFDMKIKWKVRDDFRERRQLDFSKRRSPPPSVRSQEEKEAGTQGLIRQHSDSSRSDKAKKIRADSSSGSEGMEDSSDS